MTPETINKDLLLDIYKVILRANADNDSEPDWDDLARQAVKATEAIQKYLE